MITTTLNRIRECLPCEDGWERLLRGLGKTKADDEPLAYLRILEICGLDDALWALRVEPQHEAKWRLMAVLFAREVQHLMTDPRSVAALEVAERYAKGAATEEDLAVAARDAWDAALAADAAWNAAWAARAAALAAAAWAADAAWDAALAADAALVARAAALAARAATQDTARVRQVEIFCGLVTGEAT